MPATIVIREVNAATRVITTVAGNGTAGYGGDDGPATAAELDDPSGIAVDAAGDLFIADTANNAIREVNARTTSSPPSPATEPPATAATTARPPPPSCTIPRAWRWTPAATCSSPTPTTAAIREVNAATHVITTVAGNGIAGL